VVTGVGQSMHEAATLHFDLSHLAPDQPFTLHVGSSSYDLTPHTPQTLEGARGSNSALRLIHDDRVTHFAAAVQVPADAPVLLRVTAPRLRDDEPLERLVLVSLRLPRRVRVAGAERRRQLGRPVRLPPKLTARARADTDGLPPDNELIGDITDINTAEDAAAALVFHHTELLTTQATPADDIINNFIVYARGIDALAATILKQSKAHESDPSQPNWVSSTPGTDWQTNQPSNPIYVWSDATLADLKLPLSDTLQQTKNEPTLQNQCWSVQPGVTQVPMATAPAGRVGDAEATYTLKDVTPQSGVEHSFAYDPASSTATLSLKNYYIRWLQVCVDQYGPDGEKVGQTQTLGQQSPVDTIMAVPLPPDWSDYPFTFDASASRATVSYGGLGQTPFDWTYDGGGIVWTTVFNYGIPLIFISLGVAADQGGSGWADVTKSAVSKALAFAEAAAEGPLGDAVTQSFALTDLLLAAANCAGSLVVSLITNSAQAALKAYITAAAGEGAAEKAEPFLGWAALAVGAAADLASMTETSVEVARSPATMSVDIERTLDVAVTVNPDPAHQNQWPATATTYTITITYDDGTARVYDGQLSPTTQQGPIAQTFTALPAGGTITVLACFYSATGWLAGRGSSGPLPAQPTQGSTLTVPAFAITEYLVPLSASTTYTMKEKLAFQSGNRVWVAPPAASPPTATVSDLDGSNVGANLGQLGQLALNEQQSSAGYLWKASGQGIPLVGTGNQPYTGQEFTFQAISDGASPQSGLKLTDHAYLAQPCLAFPPTTMPSPPADGFLLEPDPVTSVMWLRALSLTANQPFITSPGQAFGQFTGPQDDLAVHPAGYAVAINSDTGILQMLQLTTLAADASAPAATIYGGTGTRPGLLSNPVAVACSLDKILVLQQASATQPYGSVCAFDVKGNPVNCFAGSTTSVTSLHSEGTAPVVVLDLGVESKGYLYVLKYLAPTSGAVLASDYRLDLYNPDGSFLTQVAGLAAARLQVDLWRNLFTLNYEILAGSGRTEPSVAQWIPSTPPGSPSPGSRSPAPRHRLADAFQRVLGAARQLRRPPTRPRRDTLWEQAPTCRSRTTAPRRSRLR
jgi:hypothetical protein